MGSGETTKLKEKEEKNGKQETEYKFTSKPVAKTGWEGFLTFLWNAETGEVMGRTGISWLKIIVFYIVYYAFLAAFFMLMLLVFFMTLNDHKPQYTTEESIIGTNPGVGYRPMPASKDIQSTLIWFRHGEYNGNYKPWVDRLEADMKVYKNDSYQVAKKNSKNHPVECGDEGPGTSGFCKIKKADIFQDPCNLDNNYGFKDGTPCILIKMNQIFDWIPGVYTNVTEMPDNIPPHIKKQFETNIEDKKTHLNEKVWLDCQGENPADRENLGRVTYKPDNGYSKHYYPYENQKQYLQPVVFAHLENPKKGMMIAIECKLWFRNVVHDSRERRGLAHFELMID